MRIIGRKAAIALLLLLASGCSKPDQTGENMASAEVNDANMASAEMNDPNMAGAEMNAPVDYDDMYQTTLPDVANDNLTGSNASAPGNATGAAGNAMDARDDPQTNSSRTDVLSHLRDTGKGGLPTEFAGDQNEVIYCARLMREVARGECAFYDRAYRSLEPGLGGIDHPSQMVRGETAKVSFAIASPTLAEQGARQGIVDALGSAPDTTVPVKISSKVGARLTGEGFRIDPPALREEEITVTGTAAWEWEVTALKAPRHKLKLQIFARVLDRDGEKTRLIKTTEVPVEVLVTRGQSIGDALDSSQAWLGRGTNWLKALALFIGAMGGVWLAVKKLKGGK